MRGLQWTGQHLLSAVAEDLLGAATTTWEMHAREDAGGTGAAAEAISVELNTPALSREQIQARLAYTINGAGGAQRAGAEH